MEPNASNPEPKSGSKSGGRIIAAVACLAICGLLAGGIMPRLQQQKSLTEDTADVNDPVKTVNVITSHYARAEPLLLPSNIRALEETQIYARTSGYLTKRYVDIGSRVKQGDVLAEIASPDVDQQQYQALADQAKAVAAVGQSQADVRNKVAGVQETQSEVARARAGVEQAKAGFAGSESKLSQTRAAMASAVAKVAQTRQALEQQKAVLRQAEAQRDLADTTAKRYRELLQQGFVAQQDSDQAEATLKTASASVDSARASIGAAQANVDAAIQDVESSRAMVRAAEADVRSSQQNIAAAESALNSMRANVSAATANVGASKANVTASIAQVKSSEANSQRFSVLRSFSKIVAPFDGVITLRNADVGALVAPGDAASTKLALFNIARVDTLRIQVGVPQTYFQAVRPGTKIAILVRELPGRKFEGTIFQNAGAIDPNTRTLLTEIRIPNRDNVLLPGMYAQVQVASNVAQKAIRIPSSALMFDSTGSHVEVIGPDSKLMFVPIKIGRDFGAEVEIQNGLRGDEQIVNNPTDDLKPGESVKALAAKEGK